MMPNVPEQIFLAHAQQNALLLHRIWLAKAWLTRCEPTDKYRRHMTKETNRIVCYAIAWILCYSVGCYAVVRSAATMSRLLRGKIFCSYGSNFLKSHTFTKMILRFSSQNLPRWQRFSLPSKKILQVAVGAGATTATVCGGIIYWSSGTIDLN